MNLSSVPTASVSTSTCLFDVLMFAGLKDLKRSLPDLSTYEAVFLCLAQNALLD